MPQKPVGGKRSGDDSADVKPVTANEIIERELDRSLGDIEAAC